LRRLVLFDALEGGHKLIARINNADCQLQVGPDILPDWRSERIKEFERLAKI